MTRPRTSTLVLAGLFVAVFALWICVRPDPVVATPNAPVKNSQAPAAPTSRQSTPVNSPTPTRSPTPSKTASPSATPTPSPSGTGTLPGQRSPGSTPPAPSDGTPGTGESPTGTPTSTGTFPDPAGT